MAGYTRQSLATIINGADITAPPLNSEFNQILAAFNATTGHAHDGSTGSAPKINLTTSVSGYLPAEHGGIGGKNKLDATSAPATSNDAGEGYAPGSLWENTTNGRMYICVGNTSNAAVWRELVTVISDNQITPISTDSIDLGTPTIRFQDAYLSGGLSAVGNVSAGGNLIVTGTAAVTGDATFANLSATGTTTITSVDLNSGAIDNSAIGTTTPAAGTFTTLAANTSLTAATADINGGSIDNATIGSSTPNTGSFTTLGASGTSTLATVDINAGNIDNTVIGASTAAAGSFTTISSIGNATLATADINGGSIDGAVIGANSAAAITGTTITGTSFVGPITGAVTGNTTGSHTGSVTGNVTGDLTGNVTAASGTSSFNNVTIDGTLNMNAGTSATIQNLTAPTNDLDAATKKYVDDEISTLIGDAGAGLNTLGELADALNDDDDFSTTVTNSIATKLPLAGGTMTGAIAMSTNKITGAGDPTSAQDVATKVYTDTQRDTRVAKTGDTMSGALAMGSNKITGLGTPTAGTDATTKTYVDGILGSATASSASASAAATSQSLAATSENNAASSASAAAADRATVASLYDSFDDRYLGPKSSAPTQDNDGNALVIGALYFNSTNNIMYVYGSGGWQAAGSSVNGTSDRQTYTATAGQTVFAATYDAGYVDVYLNGVKLLAGTDFTATNGTSITLASGASVNDVVDIVAYGTFVLADHLTETQSDAKYVELAGDTMTGALTTTGLTVGNSNIGSNTSHLANMTINNNGYIGSASATTALQIPTGGGLNVTGTVTADGLTVDGTSQFNNDVNMTAATSTGPSLTVGGGNIGRIELTTNALYNAFIEHQTFGSTDTYIGNSYNNDAGEIHFVSKSDDISLAKKNLTVQNNGDISFYDTSGNQKFFWDASAERLGIGGTPAHKLHVSDATTPEIIVEDTTNNVKAVLGADNSVGRIGTDTNHPVTFRTNDTERMRISSDGSCRWTPDGTNPDMTLDASGNLIVGDTSAGGITTGGKFYATPSSGIYAAANADNAGYFNRNGGDGSIVEFRAGNAPVGSIGVADSGDRIYLAGGGAEGVGIDNGANAFVPTSETGAYKDNHMTLGRSDARFTDLYLSGGVYLGGTGSANKLDDYEYGTWTPSMNAYNGSVTSYGEYYKIGTMVTASFSITLDGTADTSIWRIANLPFNWDNTAGGAWGGCITYQDAGLDGHSLQVVTTNDVILYNSSGSTRSYNAVGVTSTIRGVVTYKTT